LSEAAAAYPERPFVISPQRAYTYADINQWSNRLARGLVSMDVGAGDHVALVMANYPEFVALKFAISRIGAIAVPMNFLFRKDELKYVIGQSDCSVLVTMERFRDLDYLRVLDEIMPGWESEGGGTTFPQLRRVITFSAQGNTRPGATSVADLEAAAKHVEQSIVDTREAAAQPHAVADVVYTSGTTGFPKGAMLTHENVLRSAYASTLIRALGDGHRTVFALPLYHVFSYIEGLLAVMWVGGAIIPQLAFDPVDTFKAIEKHGADEGLFVPTMTVALVGHPDRS
jgi:fatty-acyl-CoA synthase